MSYLALITLLGADTRSRKRKHSNGVDPDPPGGGRHVPQHQIPLISDRSQNRGDPKVGKNEEQVEQPTVG